MILVTIFLKRIVSLTIYFSAHHLSKTNLFILGRKMVFCFVANLLCPVCFDLCKDCNTPVQGHLVEPADSINQLRVMRRKNFSIVKWPFNLILY